jgi:hypothetical protein
LFAAAMPPGPREPAAGQSINDAGIVGVSQRPVRDARTDLALVCGAQSRRDSDIGVERVEPAVVPGKAHLHLEIFRPHVEFAQRCGEQEVVRCVVYGALVVTDRDDLGAGDREGAMLLHPGDRHKRLPRYP